MTPITAEDLLDEEIYDFLRREALARGLDLVFHPELAQHESRWLHLPARVEGTRDVYDFARALQELEDAWNNRQPRPQRLLWLTPAGR
jgi:hypothetical protein